MCTDDAGGLIEGVGNEVLFTVPVVAAVVVGLLGFAGWQQLRQLPSSSPAEQPPRRELTSARLNNGATAVSPVAEHSSSMETAPHYGSDAQCPICLAEPRHPVETNCGHLFCASCLVSYWHHGNWRGAVRCPVCRQQVSVMLRCFQDQHLANETDAQREERARLLRDINDYNRRYSGEPRPAMYTTSDRQLVGLIILEPGRLPALLCRPLWTSHWRRWRRARRLLLQYARRLRLHPGRRRL
ncbi:E3 ubiquitin-protein ligase RNF170-like isoform X3 [Dermacentor albipictus]|uniref:E3 ubiquitin-protein ligase RNF170-like isoform X3 n=1 Tax=Dermacentor albipictus TaxID=60249 RepID=UPI0031FD7A17